MLRTIGTRKRGCVGSFFFFGVRVEGQFFVLLWEPDGGQKMHTDKKCALYLATVRLTSIHYRVSGNQNFCFAPTETIDGR
jgi:hypothetical protein